MHVFLIALHKCLLPSALQDKMRSTIRPSLFLWSKTRFCSGSRHTRERLRWVRSCSSPKEHSSFDDFTQMLTDSSFSMDDWTVFKFDVPSNRTVSLVIVIQSTWYSLNKRYLACGEFLTNMYWRTSIEWMKQALLSYAGSLFKTDWCLSNIECSLLIVLSSDN